MKKLLNITLAALLAVSVCAFCACQGVDKELDLSKGNYVEVEAAQLQTVVEKVDGNTQDDMSGIELSADFNLSFGLAGMMTVNADGSLGYKLAVSDIEGATLAGMGECKLNYKSETAIPNSNDKTTDEASYQVSLLNDSQYIYLDISNETAGKLKINLADIIGGNDYIPEVGSGEESLSLAETLQMLSESGVKIYLDNSDVIKIKLSFTEESVGKLFETLMKMINGMVPDEAVEMIEALVSSLKFSSFKNDIYFAFDNNGKFLQYTEDMDIAFTADLSSLMPSGYNISEISVSIKGGFTLKAYNGKVTLPEGLSEDKTYTEYNPDLM